MIETAMILAAGRGERMRPLTDTMPKPSIAVAGRSMIDRTLDRLAEHGVRKTVVNVHHLAERIALHVGGRATVVRENRLLDTGGSVSNALPLLGRGPFYIVNGDALWTDGATPMLRRLEAMWDPRHMDALLLLHPLATAIGRETSDRGDYFLDAGDRARHRGEAAAAPYFFAGVSVCDARLLGDAPAAPYSLVRLWHRAQVAGRLFGLVHDGQWFHVGTPRALAEAERVLGASALT